MKNSFTDQSAPSICRK